MKEIIRKWQEKSFWAKLSDIVFVVLLIVLLIPSSRREFMRIVSSVRSQIITPRAKKDNLQVLSAKDYQWQLLSLDGKIVDFSQFQGKVVFINFWATWCGPCLGEMPEIQKLYDLYRNNSDIAFLLISEENLTTVRSFLDKKQYSFPVYISNLGIPPALQFSSIPTTFIISKRGEIVVRTVGAANWSGNKTREIIDGLLASN